MGCFLKLDVTAGTSIDNAAMDAQRVANLLLMNCEFTFNEVMCIAVPHGDYAVLTEKQQAEQRRKKAGQYDRGFASSRVK